MFPSHWELLVIFLVVLLLFGAKRIPEMAKGLGKGIREFRSAVKDVQDEVDLAGRSSSSAGNRQNAIPPSAPPEGQVPRSDNAQAAPANGGEQNSETPPAHEEAR